MKTSPRPAPPPPSLPQGDQRRAPERAPPKRTRPPAGPPEPPPFDDAPFAPPAPPPRAEAPKRAPQRAPQRPPQAPPRRPVHAGPWEKLCVDLNAIGGAAATLATGRPHLDRGTLMVSLPGGRALADGRRALRNAEVVDALARHYGDRVTADANALPNTGTEGDRRKELSRKVLNDPDVQRLVAALGATLLRAVPLTDGD